MAKTGENSIDLILLKNAENCAGAEPDLRLNEPERSRSRISSVQNKKKTRFSKIRDL